MKKVSPFHCKGKSPAAAAVHYTSWEIVGPAKKQKTVGDPMLLRVYYCYSVCLLRAFESQIAARNPWSS